MRTVCGDGVETAERSRWGFRHDTWLVTTATGRHLVAQRRAGGPNPTGDAAATIRSVVRGAGLPVPEPAGAGWDEAGRMIVTMPLVPGMVAADLLGDDAGAERAGAMCGAVAARLAGLDPALIGPLAPSWTALQGPWATAGGLRDAIPLWLDAAAPVLPVGAHTMLLGLAERAAAETARRGTRLAHGDLAPVNLLAAPGPEHLIAAVLDLDRTRLAHPGFDAAWFGWVLEHHHPATAEAALRGYASACGTAETPAAAAWLQPLVLLERLAEAAMAADAADAADAAGHTGHTAPAGAAELDRWAARLAAALR